MALSALLSEPNLRAIGIERGVFEQPVVRFGGHGGWEGVFENFAQYKARVWIGSSHVLSIVVPKRSTLILEEQLHNIF